MTTLPTLHHTILHNPNHQSYLHKHSQNILASCKKILNINPSYGEYLGPHVISVNMDSPILKEETELYHVLNIFYTMNPKYYFKNFELHIKNDKSKSTPQHSDRYTWIHSDKYLVNQAWVLLYNDTHHKNIDLYANPRCGLLNSNDNAITTLDGYENFTAKKILDGTTINVGDMLLLQNGIIHGTNPTTDAIDKNSWRIALAMSFYKYEWSLTNNLLSYYYNFWINDKIHINRSKSNIEQLLKHPYGIKKLNIELEILENPIKEYKIQDLVWYNFLQSELLSLKF
jgi:hypothetical protein